MGAFSKLLFLGTSAGCASALVSRTSKFGFLAREESQKKDDLSKEIKSHLFGAHGKKFTSEDDKPVFEKEFAGGDWAGDATTDCACDREKTFWYQTPCDGPNMSDFETEGCMAARKPGSCVNKYPLGAECGWYPEDVRPRVCQKGLQCVKGAGGAWERISSYGFPSAVAGTCQKAEKGADGEAGSEKLFDCVKTATISGKMCVTMEVSNVVCDTKESAEYKATDTATATKTADGGSVTFKGKWKSVQYDHVVEKPDSEVKVEVSVETSVAASVKKSQRGTAKAAEPICVTAEEVLEHTGKKKVTSRDLEGLKKAAQSLAEAKASEQLYQEALNDACKKAKDHAQEMAEGEAKAEAQAQASDAADAKAEAAATEQLANQKAAESFTPEEMQKHQAHADQKAKEIGQKLQQQQADSAAATAESEAQNDAVADADAAGGAAVPSAGTAPEPTGPGVKQSDKDIAATQP